MNDSNNATSGTQSPKIFERARLVEATEKEGATSITTPRKRRFVASHTTGRVVVRIIPRESDSAGAQSSTS